MMDIQKTVQSAIEHYQKGRIEEAEKLCGEILKIQPNTPDILHLSGVISLSLGNFDYAIQMIAKALEFDPSNQDAYYNMGNAFAGKKQYNEAALYYRKALHLNPNFADANNNLGFVLQELGLFDAAISHYEEALRLNPDLTDALYNLAVIYQDKNMYDEAIAHYRKALKLDPSIFDACHNLGVIFQEIKQYDRAIHYYRKAIDLHPESASPYINMGVVLKAAEQFDEAITCFQKALLIDPNSFNAHLKFGNVLQEKCLFEEAAVYYERALQIMPDSIDALYNLGTVFQAAGRLDEAIKYYEEVIGRNPDYVDAHWNISLSLLSAGNMVKGWKEYEWRWQLKDTERRKFPQPAWNGSSLKSKTIFVSAEQGVGDEIMFASCIPDIVEQAGPCIIETDARLVPLFTRSFPKARSIERMKSTAGISTFPPEVPLTDYQIAIGSIPQYFRTKLTDFPQMGSYLIADSHKVQIWRERLNALGKSYKIGISWRGGKRRDARKNRSTVLEQWMQIFLIQGVRFINLQYGDCTDELKAAKEKLGVTIHDWEEADPLKDLDNFAAQIAALDLVISADNATVHMAGALGMPVWTLLPFACDWRWMRNVDDTPWYKSMRLFRQKRPGDWDEVFERVANCLEKCIVNGASCKSFLSP